MKRLIEATESFTGVEAATEGVTYDVGEARYISVQVTETVTTPGSASVKLQKSNDGPNWTDIKTANITTNATVWLDDADPDYRYARIAFAISSGSIDTADCHILVKG